MFRVLIKNQDGKIRRSYFVDQYQLTPYDGHDEDYSWEFNYIWDGSEEGISMSNGYTVEIYYVINNEERIDRYLLYGEYLDLVQLTAGEEQ